MRYFSLLEIVPESDRKYGRVRKTVVSSKDVFFQTAKYLLRLGRASADTGEHAAWMSTIWRPDAYSYKLHSLRNQILVSLPQKLLALRGDSLHVILNHAVITNSVVDLILHYPGTSSSREKQQDCLLMCTRSVQLFLYDGISLHPFESEANAYLKKNGLFHGALLPDGRYAFATLWGGVVIIDLQGRLLQIVNKATGLHNKN